MLLFLTAAKVSVLLRLFHVDIDQKGGNPAVYPAFVEFGGLECKCFCSTSRVLRRCVHLHCPTDLRCLSAVPPLAAPLCWPVCLLFTDWLLNPEAAGKIEAQIVLEVNPRPVSVDRSVLSVGEEKAPPPPSRCLLPSPTPTSRSSLKETVSSLSTGSYESTALSPPGPLGNSHRQCFGTFYSILCTSFTYGTPFPPLDEKNQIY